LCVIVCFAHHVSSILSTKVGAMDMATSVTAPAFLGIILWLLMALDTTIFALSSVHKNPNICSNSVCLYHSSFYLFTKLLANARFWLCSLRLAACDIISMLILDLLSVLGSDYSTVQSLLLAAPVIFCYLNSAH